MRVIARSVLLVMAAAAIAHADPHDEVMQVLGKMAASLTETNVPGFMEGISKDMPEYDTLRDDVSALIKSAEVSSSIEPVTEDGDAQKYKIDLDWVLDIRSLEQDGPLVRRRQVIHCEFVKENKKWKIVSIKPLDFFAPANLGGK
jgi:hypothetical protein